MPAPGNGPWKWLSVTLGSVLITLTGAFVLSWMAFMKESVSHADAVEIVGRYSPYLEDKQALQKSLQRIETIGESNRRDIQDMKIRLERISATLKDDDNTKR